MSRVIVVVFDGVQTLDATGPAEVFATASKLSERPLYQVVLASMGGRVLTTSSGIRMEPSDLLRIRPSKDDIVIVAGGSEAPLRRALSDQKQLEWLRRAHGRVRVLGSVCSGAFLLAAAGLLDGRRAATHWSSCARLAQRFPDVQVDPKAIFVRDGSIWTSAGVTTGIDMSLALVERDHGKKLADAIAAQLVLYVRRPGFQAQFSDALVAQTEDAGDALVSALAWARANLGEVDLEGLAKRAGLSVRTLHRRCQETLSTTPAQLIERLRVEKGRALLERGPMASKELAEKCGFGSPARMNRAFERQVGLSPKAYRLLHAHGSINGAARQSVR